jgi:hypothetical protein
VASDEGLAAALDVAAGYLADGVPAVLAQEFELALPRPLRERGRQPAEDYSLGLLVARWPVAGLEIVGELAV